MMGNPPAVVAAAAVAGEGERHTVDSGRLLEEAEAEVHHCSILEMIVVDVRAVVEVFEEAPDTKVVSSGEAGTQASAGIGSAVVAALGSGMDHAEEVGEKTRFVVVENTYFEGVVVGWESKMASLCCFPTFLTQRRDREWGSVVVGVVACSVGEVVVSVEPVETVLTRIGRGFPQGLAGRSAFEKVEAKVGAGECS